MYTVIVTKPIVTIYNTIQKPELWSHVVKRLNICEGYKPFRDTSSGTLGRGVLIISLRSTSFSS